MKYDVFVLMCACVVNKRLWRAQQALNAQCYKCQVMGVLACKCVHVRELKNPSVEAINYWLSRFVVGCRRRDGKHYPSTTLYQLLAGLLRYSRCKSKDCSNFLDKTDARFRELRGACDSVSRNLRKEGVGAEVKHASIFSPEEELKLWSSGAIGTHSPLALVRAVFYTLGKSLCLRGGQEVPAYNGRKPALHLCLRSLNHPNLSIIDRFPFYVF